MALLEAGPLSPPSASPSASPSEARRQQVQARCYAYADHTAHLFVDDLDNPYESPEDAPFAWIRSRVVGGRLHTWARTSVRMSERDLKAAEEDGIGQAWPISYADLAPHYDRVERFMAVCGVAARCERMPDGRFGPSPALSSAERDFAARVERRWPTRTVTSARIAEAPAGALVEAAKATGRLTLLPDSIASRVIVEDGGGRAAGVAFVKRLTGREEELRAPVTILCASTIESTRLLLNSASEVHPDGLGNSSGMLGHYLMDHTYGIGIDGHAPWRWRPGGGRSSHGCLVPAFRNVTEPGADFVRSYEIELRIEAPEGGRLAGIRGRRSGMAWIRAFGEVLPRFENQVAIDPERVDAWGIPAVRVECRYGENERRMAADQHRCLEEMVALAGWEVERSDAELGPPGLSVHEVGTARMGADPETSVLDPHNRCWDVPNLFVTDGSCFVSGGSQNPTLTMMAITVRACGFVVEQLRRGEL